MSAASAAPSAHFPSNPPSLMLSTHPMATYVAIVVWYPMCSPLRHVCTFGETEMPLREALGLSLGSQTQVPVPLVSGFPVKKPCRSVSAASFVAPKVPLRKRHDSYPAK